MIREYRDEDLPELEECYVELQEFERRIEPLRLEGHAIKRRYVEYMLRRCRETSGRVFVAEVEEQIVGFVCIWAQVKSDVMESVEHDYAYISDLVVLPAYRGRGLGRALLHAAEEYAVSAGAGLLKLKVLAENTSARSLYRDSGFDDYLVTMSKHLPATDG